MNSRKQSLKFTEISIQFFLKKKTYPVGNTDSLVSRATCLLKSMLFSSVSDRELVEDADEEE